MQLTGAEILLECLIEQGVDTIFGYPGGAVLNIYDALYKYEQMIRHVLTAHEQGASHAADGYARATGKVGVCLATSGPGATNLVTGIATAYMDSVPMVAITGNVALPLLGKDSFQEVDITGITMPITKHNFIVKNINELASIVRKAFYIAQEGRPGPVLIDIPKDITAQLGEYKYEKPRVVDKSLNELDEVSVANAIGLISGAKKPYLYIGGGVITAEATEELKTFAEKIQAPVSSSLMGLGGFTSDHPLFTGMIGMHGTRTSNAAVSECDLLIAVGARFSDRVIGKVSEFANSAQILHIDVDPAEINKNIVTTHHLVGDIKEVLKVLNSKINNQERPEWTKKIKEWKEKYPLSYCEDDSLKPQYIIEKISEITNGDAIITTEVGQNQMWTAQYYQFKKPRTFVSSGGLGTMGFGLGASMGAQVACPDKTVFNISGDGCFRMNCNELATAVEYNIPVIIVILNNHVLGMVRQWQNIFYGGRFSATNLEGRTTDFVKLAEAYGAVAYNITKKEEVEDTIRRAIAVKKPVVINCEIDKDEKVLPMVPPGAPLSHLILE
ncbi:biosynthetic-type acetolactate synthase large subunit [Serpentinicella alkaliphila]|uniref:Acetolactate synthase n=1 Tax=Serpentinicella alkaliphila TaxID=1734049 RepID=A0A4R2TKP1_9FIRM|nr:biosynthetic-type acetolactate synthase large subunit [Serpentinicella alkaliphila]QUH24448.1 biosynthetic-type acetolactate synthase large subunit [Serpentinicella alkaliphila]TCQ04158.1 acetolactate synthase large subunit [Serpentinicella alkaliphila]